MPSSSVAVRLVVAAAVVVVLSAGFLVAVDPTVPCPATVDDTGAPLTVAYMASVQAGTETLLVTDGQVFYSVDGPETTGRVYYRGELTAARREAIARTVDRTDFLCLAATYETDSSLTEPTSRSLAVAVGDDDHTVNVTGHGDTAPGAFETVVDSLPNATDLRRVDRAAFCADLPDDAARAHRCVR